VILIWHNGGEHSDQRIYFIDIGATPPADVEAALNKADRHKCGQRVIAVAVVEWRDPKAMMSLPAFVAEANVAEFAHTAECPMGMLRPVDPTSRAWPAPKWVPVGDTCDCHLADLQRLAKEAA
jgi:hypothetical protein